MKRYICDGIVKGATHVRNQMPCQDNKKIVEISDQIAIVAVADGHGSSKCPRSDRGSQIAVNSFYEVMKKEQTDAVVKMQGALIQMVQLGELGGR